MNTTANKITLFRIALVPVFLALLYLKHPYIAFSVYLIACLSDTVDGYVARHYGQITDFGKFVDPLADKILVVAAMCVFTERGQMPGWALAVVLFREFAVTGLRLIAADRQRVIAAAVSGKIKTVITMVCVGAMMLLGEKPLVNSLSTGVILIVTVYSGTEYFVKNIDVFKS